MPNKKLTDAEIVRVLDLLHKRILKDKFASRVSEGEMLALVEVKDLINRKQAEIEKLQMVIDEVTDLIHPLPFETDYDKAIKQAKAEAVKEFAEKYKAEINEQYCMMEYHNLYLDAIDHVLERIDVNYE